ncbi:uncharacterized protein LOC126792351 [Argentina anserina]|uniref:uncharacterized protein LOC126792351 n=1 Tax=Argentina anserina TaxID=57926 RepID=UPI002176344A|nr:uncharacterized protein LOC126792351 [Potentilla anserina]
MTAHLRGMHKMRHVTEVTKAPSEDDVDAYTKWEDDDGLVMSVLYKVMNEDIVDLVEFQDIFYVGFEDKPNGEKLHNAPRWYTIAYRSRWASLETEYQGIPTTEEAELREECREWGMLGLRSVEEMRQQLRDWLDLSLSHSMPSSLLILSRAFYVSGKLKPEEAVRATLTSMPDEVVDTINVTSLPSEDSVSERRRKLEFLEMQEEMIKEEEEREEEEQRRTRESKDSQEDVALKEMTIPTTREAQEQARERTLEKQEQLCELSRALAVLASASSVSTEREEFLRLVSKEIELYNSIVEKDGTDGEKDAFRAYRAARDEIDTAGVEDEADHVSSALIDKVDSMLQNLEKEIDDVDAQIGDRYQLLDRDFDGKVTAEEVAAAANYLKNTLGKEGVQELIGNLSKDRAITLPFGDGFERDCYR